MSATKAAKKIQLLNALINHPSTSEEERDAGRRMLARVIASAKAKGENITSNGYIDRRTYGSKYDKARGLRLADIAKLMREDIKLARKIGLKAAGPGALATIDPIGNAPASIKYAVRTQTYSGGGSINIIIKGIPADWYTVETDDRGDAYPVASAALNALRDELRLIHEAYNYNGSDLMVDYFDVNYYGGVRVEYGF